MCFYGTLDSQQVIELYNNSKDDLTQAFSIPVGFSTQDVSPISIVNQPNWFALTQGFAEYLAVPASISGVNKLIPYRLNTTAIKYLVKLLNQSSGVDALLTPSAQSSEEIPFSRLASVVGDVFSGVTPSDQIDFTPVSAMSDYYWELFFHLPFLVGANALTHQQFKLAQKWLRYVFNPASNDMNETNGDQYWNFLGLRQSDNPALKNELSLPYYKEIAKDLADPAQLYISQEDPFDPHAIAALRPIAYQKSMVMHYVDMLIAWGDMLYIENTRESIIEAEMLYVEAYDLLGSAPKNLGPETLSAPLNYTDESSIIPGDSLPDLSEVSDISVFNNTVYAATIHGLYKLVDGQWQQEDFDQVQQFYSLQAYNGDLYAGGNGGLYRLRNDVWSNINTLINLAAHQAIYALSSDGDYLYIGTASETYQTWQGGGFWPVVSTVTSAPTGVYKIDGATVLQHDTSIPSNPSISSLIIHNDVLYAGGVNQGIYQRSSDGTYTKMSGVGAEGNIYLCESGGHLYAVSNKNMYVLSAGSWVAVPGSVSGLNSIAAMGATILAAGNNQVYEMLPGGSLQSIKTASNAKVFVSEDYIYTGGAEINFGTYFGIPRNTQFLSYWDTLNSRLYNIRHSLTIDGKKDILPIFQPPINPMQLVAAVGSGQSVQAATHMSNSIVPHYRFETVHARARSVASTVVELGQTLLSVLEKKDAEKLAMLYNTQQRDISEMMRASKQDALSQAKENVKSLQSSLLGAIARSDHYNTFDSIRIFRQRENTNRFGK